MPIMPVHDHPQRTLREQLKDLTRGKDGITRETLHAFIRTLKLPAAEQKRLLAMTPANYIGKAAELAKKV